MGANAQTSVPTFTAGEILTAANMNISARTGIPVFADDTARNAAFGGTGEKTLAEGQICFIEAAPQRYQIYNGTVFKDFNINYTDISSTQVFSGFTKGNASVTSKFTQFGDFCHFFGGVVLGSTSSMTGALDVTLPLTSDKGIFFMPGTCLINDTSASTSFINVFLPLANTTIRIVVASATTTYTQTVDITASVPMTWATGDSFYWNHFFKVA